MKEEIAELLAESKKLTALYVEDDRDVRREGKELLENIFFQIDEAENGEEGLTLYKEKGYDVIFTDINMPLMDGLEMVEKIKEFHPAAKIVFMTAFGDEEKILRALDLKAEAYLKKPTKLENLLHATKKVVESIAYENKEDEKKRLLVDQARYEISNELLSKIAHHWRNPLNVISVNLQMLKEDYEYGEDLKNFFEEKFPQMESKINEMSESIEIFSSIYKESRASILFNVAENINKVVLVVGPLFEEKNISFILDIEEALEINSKPNEFNHVISILITNSCEAATKDNKVEIESKNIDENTFQVRIKDDCGGISEEIITNLFMPYNSTKPANKRSGLGLYVAKNIVKYKLNGQIEIKNIENGTEVLMTLPKKL